MIFDNSKIKQFVPDFQCTVPFSHGAREILAWYDADPSRRAVDGTLNAAFERILAGYKKAYPN
jgi:hypothetical protein